MFDQRDDREQRLRLAVILLRAQVRILSDLAKRFRGEYAWIEKAQAHACDVAMIMEETVRKADLVYDVVLGDSNVSP